MIGRRKNIATLIAASRCRRIGGRSKLILHPAIGRIACDRRRNSGNLSDRWASRLSISGAAAKAALHPSLIDRVELPSLPNLSAQIKKISTQGTTRCPVIIIGTWAFKFARGDRGRRCNLYEANLYGTTTPERREMLCPVHWCSRKGFLLIAQAATPLDPVDQADLVDGDAFPDFNPDRARAGIPFEPKETDSGVSTAAWSRSIIQQPSPLNAAGI